MALPVLLSVSLKNGSGVQFEMEIKAATPNSKLLRVTVRDVFSTVNSTFLYPVRSITNGVSDKYRYPQRVFWKCFNCRLLPFNARARRWACQASRYLKHLVKSGLMTLSTQPKAMVCRALRGRQLSRQLEFRVLNVDFNCRLEGSAR